MLHKTLTYIIKTIKCEVSLWGGEFTFFFSTLKMTCSFSTKTVNLTVFYYKSPIIFKTVFQLTVNHIYETICTYERNMTAASWRRPKVRGLLSLLGFTCPFLPHPDTNTHLLSLYLQA